MAGRENGNMPNHRVALARQRVHFADAVDLVAEKFDTDGHIVHIGEVDLNNVAPHAEFVSHEVEVVALVLQRHQAVHQLIAAHVHALRAR